MTLNIPFFLSAALPIQRLTCSYVFTCFALSTFCYFQSARSLFSTQAQQTYAFVYCTHSPSFSLVVPTIQRCLYHSRPPTPLQLIWVGLVPNPISRLRCGPRLASNSIPRLRCGPRLASNSIPSLNDNFLRDKEEDSIVVYADGSCHNKGLSNPKAGAGVYCPMHPERSRSIPLPNVKTNNQAELYAIIHAFGALKMTAGNQSATIRTDSKYAVDCINMWMPKWSANGWKTVDGKPVEHQKEIQEIIRLKNQRAGHTSIEWVPGHAKSNSSDDRAYGNNMADRLANRGAQTVK